MPQISPMLWFILYIYFFFCFFLSMLKIYYIK